MHTVDVNPFLCEAQNIFPEGVANYCENTLVAARLLSCMRMTTSPAEGSQGELVG